LPFLGSSFILPFISLTIPRFAPRSKLPSIKAYY